MKIALLIAGLALAMLGTVLMMYQDVTITTHAQKVLEVGPLQATTEQTSSTYPISPIIGGVLAIAGVAMVFAGAYLPRRRHGKQVKQESTATGAIRSERAAGIAPGR